MAVIVLYSLLQELLCIGADKKATMPLRVGLNVLYSTPMPEFNVGNLMCIPLSSSSACVRCDSRKCLVAAVTPTHSGSDTDDDCTHPRPYALCSPTSSCSTGAAGPVIDRPGAVDSDSNVNDNFANHLENNLA